MLRCSRPHKHEAHETQVREELAVLALSPHVSDEDDESYAQEDELWSDGGELCRVAVGFDVQGLAV